MSLPNPSLAMMAIVLSAYDKEDGAHALMAIAEQEPDDSFDLPGTTVAAILSKCGLECIFLAAGRGPVPDFVQDAADRDHLVLICMRQARDVPYEHWGVLEKRRPDQQCVITLAREDSSEEYPLPLEHYTTGEYVIIREKCPNLERLTRQPGNNR